MVIVSVLIIVGIVILCLLPVLFRSFRSFDKTADDIEARNADVATGLREARNQIDRGSRHYGGRF